MNTEREFIQAMLSLIQRYAPRQQTWSRWECTEIEPLAFTGYGGEIRAGGTDGMPLVLTETAANVVWKKGMEAAGYLNPGGLLIIDRISE